MKKYVLNIDRLYTGATANALVLDQVDQEFPQLIPSIDSSVEDVGEFLAKWVGVYSSFSPPDTVDVNELNSYIMDFNLNLQKEYKKRGHSELYMMDDTTRLKPDEESYLVGKTYLHCLNGRACVETWDDDGSESVSAQFNSSQLNVLFPYKKISVKSLYASQLSVKSSYDMDDALEKSRGITIQGKLSFQDCVQSVSQAGNELYVMSTNIPISGDCIYGNYLTVVNGFELPYYFPNTMTLFQPGQQQYKMSNLLDWCRGCGFKGKISGKCPKCGSTDIVRDEFINWYEYHNHKTILELNETYGTNVTIIDSIGADSYSIQLGTYSPTDIVLMSDPKSYSEKDMWIRLNSDTFRTIRSEEHDFATYQYGKYVFDNDYGGSQHVMGLLFNLYDTFITENDRVLRMHVPIDRDYNKLILSFDWSVLRDDGLFGDMEVVLMVGDQKLIDQNFMESTKPETYQIELNETNLRSNDIDVVVRIRFSVDFGRRNSELAYRQLLQRSGVVIGNIRVENGVLDVPYLTFGSYVNETGISEEEQQRRYNQFWEVSQYKRNLTYQTVVESSLRNYSSAGIKYGNNYSSGDMYGDMFVTKSVLDPRYDMNIELYRWDDENRKWTDDRSKPYMMKVEGRDYIGTGQCSNQLSLLYKPMDIAIGHAIEDQRIYTRRVNPEPELKYQMVEVVKNINRFESSIKHKSNVFSVVVENSNLAADPSVDMSDENSESAEYKLEKYKAQLRNSITQFVRNTCEGVVPVHTQLFDVQFT